MQLTSPPRPSVRTRLRAAACLLLASSLPALAQAAPAQSPGWQLDATALAYAERQRTQVVEPVGRLTRMFSGGQTFSAQLALDAITGASPTGAVPSGQVQTTTSASGVTTSQVAGQVPTHQFTDFRGAADLELGLPIGSLFNATTGATYSLEKDYRSVGLSETFSLDVLHRLATLTVGGGVDRDEVFPAGGTRVPLGQGTQDVPGGSNRKQATNGLVGFSRVLSRRWLAGVSLSGTREEGYLTEPYKVISVVDPATGGVVSQLNESRPSTRERRAILANSTYHLTENLLYLEYRYYWDGWGIRSHTADARYRVDLHAGQYLLPHVRLYSQSPARFYRPSLTQGEPLPDFASADYRLGPLHGVTLGGTYGFRLPGQPGEWSVRAEYMRQWGHNGPGGEEHGEHEEGGEAVSAPSAFDPIPGLDVGWLVLGYTLRF